MTCILIILLYIDGIKSPCFLRSEIANYFSHFKFAKTGFRGQDLFTNGGSRSPRPKSASYCEFRSFINKKLPRKRHAKVEDTESSDLGALTYLCGSFKGEPVHLFVFSLFPAPISLDSMIFAAAHAASASAPFLVFASAFARILPLTETDTVKFFL